MEVGAALKGVCDGTRDVSERVRVLDGQLEGYATRCEDGVSLLRLKSALLLRYTANLTRFAAARIRGEAPTNAVRTNLVSQWAALERIRPLERRLRSQLDALAATANSTAPMHRPNASAMVNASDSSSDEEEDATSAVKPYVPPRFAAVNADLKDETRRAERDAKRTERMRRGAGARAMLDELRGMPDRVDEEVREGSEMRARARFEEMNFVRMSRSKRDRQVVERLQKAARGETRHGELAGLAGIADRVIKKKDVQAASPRDGVMEMTSKVRALDEASNGGSRSARKRRRRGKR